MSMKELVQRVRESINDILLYHGIWLDKINAIIVDNRMFNSNGVIIVHVVSGNVRVSCDIEADYSYKIRPEDSICTVYVGGEVVK